jgi:hypothetical protein
MFLQKVEERGLVVYGTERYLFLLKIISIIIGARSTSSLIIVAKVGHDSPDVDFRSMCLSRGL